MKSDRLYTVVIIDSDFMRNCELSKVLKSDEQYVGVQPGKAEEGECKIAKSKGY